MLMLPFCYISCIAVWVACDFSLPCGNDGEGAGQCHFWQFNHPKMAV